MLTALAPFDGDTILSLAEARVQCRLTADDDFHDSAVTDARDDAIAWFEEEASVSLQERQFLWTEAEFSCRMDLPRRPVTAIDSVSYYDEDGIDTALVEADWYFGDNTIEAAAGTSWPSSSGQRGSVRVTFTAGYSLAEDIPRNAMRAVKLALTAYFDDRSNPDLTVARQHADRFRVMVA